MKTFKSLTTAISILSAAFVFTLTSCQKDELPLVTRATSPQIDQAAAPVDPTTQRFQMISIDHNSGPARAADYNVTIMSDGQFIFEGRKNTATIGIRTINLSKEMMGTLKEYFSGDNFEGINQGPVSNDLATLTVSYKEDILKGVTTRTANEISQSKLITFNKKLEEILNVKAFTTSGNTGQSTFPIEHN